MEKLSLFRRTIYGTPPQYYIFSTLGNIAWWYLLQSIMSSDWTALPLEIRDLIFGVQSMQMLGTLRLVCRRYCSHEAVITSQTPIFFFKKKYYIFIWVFLKLILSVPPVGVMQQEIYGAASALMTISPFQSYKELSGYIPTAPLCCLGMHWWYGEFTSIWASRNMILFDCSYKAVIYTAFLNYASYKNCSCRFMLNSITSLYAPELTLASLTLSLGSNVPFHINKQSEADVSPK